jgi:hypothetical protein
MSNNWRLVGMALLSVGLVFSPAVAREDKEPPRTQGELIAEILQRLGQMEKTLNDRCNNILRAVEDVKYSNDVRVSSCEKEIEEIKKQIGQIKKEVEKLGGSAPRVALYPPNSNTGTIHIRNSFPADITVKVNEQPYVLRPNSEITLPPLTAGTFSYEVQGVRARQVQKLAANETFTIDVFPQ